VNSLAAQRVFIVAARRTPVARVGGPLKSVPPEVLAATAIRAVLADLGGSACVDDVLLGNAVGGGGNLARVALLEAGLPLEVPGGTLDRQCGSGLSAILLAASAIRAGDADLVLAGGVESASRAPWKVERPPSLYGWDTPRFIGRTPFAPASVGDPEMGEAAENVAERYGISREAQDDYALESHRRYGRAAREGRFTPELAPVDVDGEAMAEDEAARGARDEARLEALRERLARLKPAFREGGTVTAGNSCGVNDGAAVVALASEAAVRARGWQPLAEVRSSATVGVDPNVLGIGPAPALRRCLERADLSLGRLDLVEINEAFASQVLACVQELALPTDILNVGGGALALGHPYGASGAIILTRLVRELARLGLRRGAAAIGMAGGMGGAVIVERVA
jgi:acetyl-CoA C-acetyltransferase